MGALEIGTISVTGKFGVYAEVGGHADFVPFLRELSGACHGSSDLESTVQKFGSMVSNGKYKIFGQPDLVLHLNLKQLINLEIPQFEVTAGASAMLSLEWDLNDPSKSKLVLYAGRTAKLDIMQFSAQLGPFGELIRSSVQMNMDMSQRICMAFTLKPEFQFVTDFEVKAIMDCGPLKVLLDTTKKSLKGLPNGVKIIKAVWPEVVTNSIDTVCGQKSTVSARLTARVSFGWKGFSIDRAGTLLELTADSKKIKVSLADLPICPPGASIGDSCSANTDCYSEDKA